MPPPELIPIPPAFRHQRIDVIVIALDQAPEKPVSGVDVPGDPIKAFRGKGRGGSVGALLRARRIDLALKPAPDSLNP
jgi:hypothetical protein